MPNFSFTEYQKAAHEFAVTKELSGAYTYPTYALIEEVGEVAGLFARRVRGDFDSLEPIEFIAKLHKELGDVLWNLAELCTQNSISLEAVAQNNLTKLRDRKVRGVLQGKGDNR